MYWTHKKVYYDAKRHNFVKCNDVVLYCMIYTSVHKTKCTNVGNVPIRTSGMGGNCLTRQQRWSYNWGSIPFLW